MGPALAAPATPRRWRGRHTVLAAVAVANLDEMDLRRGLALGLVVRDTRNAKCLLLPTPGPALWRAGLAGGLGAAVLADIAVVEDELADRVRVVRRAAV